MNATTVAVDLAKSVFQIAVADEHWHIKETQRLTRTQFERWFANRSVSLVVMEACGSAHHWARWLNALGIEVRLLPAQYVRPRPSDADNSSGSLPAACNDWRDGPADSMLARTTTESTSDAGYTTAGVSPTAKTSISFLPLWGSPYTRG